MSHNLTELLQFDRAAIANGEIWRIITSHLTHWNAEHLLWDILTLGGLGIICEQWSRKGFLICLATSGLFISLGVWAFLPEIDTYRGLSGVVSALFIYTAAWIIIEKIAAKQWKPAAIAGLATIAFISKTIYEACGSTLFVQPHGLFAPMPIAHLIGGTTGAFCALAFFYTNSNNRPSIRFNKSQPPLNSAIPRPRTSHSTLTSHPGKS